MWTGSSMGNCHSNFLRVNNSLRATPRSTHSTSANTNIAIYYKSSINSCSPARILHTVCFCLVKQRLAVLLSVCAIRALFPRQNQWTGEYCINTGCCFCPNKQPSPAMGKYPLIPFLTQLSLSVYMPLLSMNGYLGNNTGYISNISWCLLVFDFLFTCV